MANSFAEQVAQGVGSVVPGTDESQSIVRMPIIGTSRALGVIQLENYERENAFGESELRLLSTVASSMGVALENARLFDETQRLLKETEQRATELAVINKIQEGMAAELDFQAIVDLVGDKLREVFHTGDIGIWWWDESTRLTHPLYVFEHGARLTGDPFPVVPGGAADRIVSGREILVAGTRAEQQALGFVLMPGTDPSHSIVGVPIVGGDRVIGSILIENHEREHAYADADVRLLTTVAASMGVALENARLFDETQRLLKETEQRATELAVINSVQQGVAAELDFQAIIDLVGDKLRDVFHTGNIGIRWWDAEAGLVHYLYEFEYGNRLEMRPNPPSPGGVWERMMANRQPWVANNAAEMNTGVKIVPGTDMCKSIVQVPILAGERMLGAISLENMERENAFAPADVRLLSTVASGMGVALENARLFAETQRLLKETEQRAAELAVINSVQQGVAAELDFQAIVDLVGDRLREVLHTGDIGIRWFDYDKRVVHYLYEYEHGVRLNVPSAAPSTPWENATQRREPQLVNTAAEMAKIGLVPGTDRGKSSLQVRIVGGDRVLGSIIIEDYEREYAFTESDVRLLTTVASAMGVALENARLFDETQRLLKETEERAAELAVINGIQDGIAAELDFQSIIDLVGDKLRVVFAVGDLSIAWYDAQRDLLSHLYTYELGKRIQFPPSKPLVGGPFRRIVETRRPIIANSRTELDAAGFRQIEGTAESFSLALIPIVGTGAVLGSIQVENYDRENAFRDSDVRLLTTVASAMGVALENARLFGETQRLLKETEERAAELAIINSVQQALAAKLDLDRHLHRGRRQDPRHLRRRRRRDPRARSGDESRPHSVHVRARQADCRRAGTARQSRLQCPRDAYRRKPRHQRAPARGDARLRQHDRRGNRERQVDCLRAAAGARHDARPDLAVRHGARARVHRFPCAPAGDAGQQHERRARQRAPVRRDAAPLQAERAARRAARDRQQRPARRRRRARLPGDRRPRRQQDRDDLRHQGHVDRDARPLDQHDDHAVLRRAWQAFRHRAVFAHASA